MAVQPLVTRAPRRSGSKTSDGLSSVLYFSVLADNEFQAMERSGVPRYGDAHPDKPALRVDSISAELAGEAGQAWTVSVTYRVPENSAQTNQDDPLKAPLRWRWETALTNEPVDQDIYGNPIVNSARQGFSNPANDTVISLILNIVRNEPRFDVRKSLKFVNKVNSDKFWGADPGQVKCIAFAPSDDTTVNSRYVPVHYRFEMRADGFKTRLQDQGYYELIGASAGNATERLLPILDKNSEPVTYEVPLNGGGRPYYPASVLDRQGGGVTLPRGVELEDTGRAAFLKYTLKHSAKFAELGLDPGGQT